MSEALEPPSDKARIWKRGAQITVARPLSPSELASTSVAPNGTIIGDLRTEFRVEKSLGKDPNTAEVTLTNLSERTRAEVQKKPLYVRIDAGYDGLLERLFTGSLRWAASRLDRVDWVTKLELADGDRAFRYARVSRSFKGAVTGRQAVSEIARTMGLAPRYSKRAAAELGAQYAAGLSLTGQSADELSRVLAAFGMTWSIQDETLQILLADEHRDTDAIVITQETGLVGSPEYGAPALKGKDKRPILAFTTALKPGLTPGGRVKVASRHVNGLFKVYRVTHRGDTHGGDWVSEVEAKAA